MYPPPPRGGNPPAKPNPGDQQGGWAPPSPWCEETQMSPPNYAPLGRGCNPAGLLLAPPQLLLPPSRIFPQVKLGGPSGRVCSPICGALGPACDPLREGPWSPVLLRANPSLGLSPGAALVVNNGVAPASVLDLSSPNIKSALSPVRLPGAFNLPSLILNLPVFENNASIPSWRSRHISDVSFVISFSELFFLSAAHCDATGVCPIKSHSITDTCT